MWQEKEKYAWYGHYELSLLYNPHLFYLLSSLIPSVHSPIIRFLFCQSGDVMMAEGRGEREGKQATE
jgi:hypothetical protein